METANEYAAALEQNLASARELVEHPTANAYGGDAHDRHAVGVVYLAGYVVEAALRNYVVRKCTPRGTWPTNYEPTLKDIATLPGVKLPTDSHSIADWWQFSGLLGRDRQMDINANACSIWKPSWRYGPPRGKAHVDAVTFLAAAEQLARWMLTQS